MSTGPPPPSTDMAAQSERGRSTPAAVTAAWKRAVGVAGRRLQALWRLRLGWLAGHALLVVTHVGRRTGALHRTVLYVQRYDPPTRDPALGRYRATVADCYGHAEVMQGWIDGDQLTFESTPDAPVRTRLVWDATDPDQVIWRNEASAGGPWTLVEEYRCLPVPV